MEAQHVTNRLLLSLPQKSFARLSPMLHLENIERGRVINSDAGPNQRMYFVNRGLVSLVKTMHDGRTAEVGAVGIEGVTDSSALFGIGEASLETVVQVPGSALRISRKTLKHEMECDAALRVALERYARFAYGQIAQTAACNRLHSMEERCCRWLLICHDNALSDTFPLTHEFLATMLGVQRSGVSIVASLLRRAGLIRYSRNLITVTDRAGLEEAACECYAEMRDELRNLFLHSGHK